MSAYSIYVKLEKFDPELGVALLNVNIDDKAIESLSEEARDEYVENKIIQEINRNIGWAVMRRDH